MKKTMILGAALGAAMIATTAGAATTSLNFVEYANTVGEHGVTSGTIINFGGLDVTFSAKKAGGTGDAYPYFDESIALEDGAGLGVCKHLDADKECTPNSDDNVTTGESVTIAFDTAQKLRKMFFNAEGHMKIADDLTLLFGINGDPLARWTFGALSAAKFTGVTSATFAFDSGRKGDQFYVGGATVSPVPLPAAGFMLLTALGGLAAARRRKSA